MAFFGANLSQSAVQTLDIRARVKCPIRYKGLNDGATDLPTGPVEIEVKTVRRPRQSDKGVGNSSLRKSHG